MSQIASSPSRIRRKAPFSIHSKEICPFAVLDGWGRKAACDHSISHSPTTIASCLRAGLCLGELVCAILFLLSPVSLHVPLDSSYHRQAYSDKRWVPPGASARMCWPSSESVWLVKVYVSNKYYTLGRIVCLDLSTSIPLWSFPLSYQRLLSTWVTRELIVWTIVSIDVPSSHHNQRTQSKILSG